MFQNMIITAIVASFSMNLSAWCSCMQGGESLPEVERLCQALMQSGAASSATAGKKLQGRAFASEFQVCDHP